MAASGLGISLVENQNRRIVLVPLLIRINRPFAAWPAGPHRWPGERAPSGARRKVKFVEARGKHSAGFGRQGGADSTPPGADTNRRTEIGQRKP